ncbi:MAG: SMP-30/gluconolactonase/LRE family protein [Betaproteobacteria bacterium]|nr:SMP-30/gluconolactonase/LRE family protein [Betaproteobacteria bacterium]
MSDIKILATGLKFPEGPAVLADGSVVFTEIAGGTIKRVTADGTLSEFAVTGGGPNGIAVGPDGALYVCNNGGNDWEQGGHIAYANVGIAKDYAGGYIQRVDPKSKEVRVLYTHYGPNKLSAPNDIVFDAHGGFYFSDIGKRHKRYREHGGLYYATIDGANIREVAYPVGTPNGVGLSPSGDVLYYAETDTSRLWAYDIVEPGVVKKLPYPSPNGGRLIGGLPGYQRFDSLALESNGNVCVATFVTGYITVMSPAGEVVRKIKMPDVFPTNICFGGPDLRTAYITLSGDGKLASMTWPEPGLKLNYY